MNLFLGQINKPTYDIPALIPVIQEESLLADVLRDYFSVFLSWTVKIAPTGDSLHLLKWETCSYTQDKPFQFGKLFLEKVFIFPSSLSPPCSKHRENLNFFIRGCHFFDPALRQARPGILLTVSCPVDTIRGCCVCLLPFCPMKGDFSLSYCITCLL